MSCRLSLKIIKQFSSKNMFGFTLHDVAEEFPQNSPCFLAKTLSSMAGTGMLKKITRDIYHIIPLHADPDTYVPDGLQVAKYIMLNKEYYIGYASALKILGLGNPGLGYPGLGNSSLKIDGLKHQSEGRIFVVTSEQMKPALRDFGGITLQFIRHEATRFFGFSSIWINQFEKAMVSDLERTIVDLATRPQYCGGIIEVGNALIEAKDRTDHDKLFYYFARNMNKSAKKRFLFLSDLLGLEWTADLDRMMEELGSGISILDPSVPVQGRIRMKFGLKINVDPAYIKKEILYRRIP